MKKLFVLACACVPLLAHADDGSDAQALFDLGIREMKDGRLAEACRHLAASLAKLPDSGTKGALAVCSTKQGKLATAWTLWRDLAVTAPTDAMRRSAAQAAQDLEPRLPRYQITEKPAVAGLVVEIDGARIDLTVDVPLPVDPGKLTIRASAPDHQDYTAELTAAEGQLVRIAIPALLAASRPPLREQAPVVVQRNRAALGLVIGGGVSLATGAAFGLRARSRWNAAERACGGDVDACPSAAFAGATDSYAAARTAATTSTIFVGIGAAAVIGGALWYRLGRRPSDRTALIPTVSRDGVGLVVAGDFR